MKGERKTDFYPGGISARRCFSCLFVLQLGIYNATVDILVIKGSLGGETSVLRTFRMSGKELVKERVSQRNS